VVLLGCAGERIKELRLENDMTQADVANYLGIGKQAVYKYEVGAVTNIPLENIEKLAALFKTTPMYLAGWDDKSSESISPDEHRLLTAYRGAEETAKQIAMETLLNHQKQDTAAGQTGS
jgi:transcriptional regulator with XRE-family HTH domain